MARTADTEGSRNGTQELFTFARNEALTRMDGGPILAPKRIKGRFDAIRKQVLIGLTREGGPTTADRGLLTARLNKPDFEEAWRRAPGGADSGTIIGNFGSTNWGLSRWEKNKQDGSINVERFPTIVHHDNDGNGDSVRVLSVRKFVGDMAASLIEAHKASTNEDTYGNPVNIGVKFGFPSRYEEDPETGNTYAIITDVQEGGIYSKNWKFTDLQKGEEFNATAHIVDLLQQAGINVGTVYSENDTNAVEDDLFAKQQALKQRAREREQTLEPGKDTEVGHKKPELEIVKGAIVGGGGTNSCANGANLESGRARYTYDDIYSEAEGEVHEAMRTLGLVEGPKIAEQETGAMIVARTAAELYLLDKKYKVLDGGEEYARKLLQKVKEDQTIVDTIAYGKPDGDLALTDANRETIKNVAWGEMIRAGQNYGILFANTILASLEGRVDDPVEHVKSVDVQYGMLAEGSALLKGTGIREVASAVAQELLGLKHLPVFIDADGDRGIAQHTISRKYLDLAS